MSEKASLACVPLFAGFSTEEIGALIAFVRSRRYPRGSIIFHKGDPGTTLYIVEAGEVKLTLSSAAGDEIILALVGPGGFFGELALLDGEPRSANAVARVACELLALERNQLLHFLERHPRAAASLLAALSRRLRRTTELVHEAAFLDVSARLASLLLQLTEARSQPGPDGVVRSPQLTQEELAELIGATRVSVNKWLGVYEREGLVRRHKGFVTVLRPEELRRRLG